MEKAKVVTIIILSKMLLKYKVTFNAISFCATYNIDIAYNKDNKQVTKYGSKGSTFHNFSIQ